MTPRPYALEQPSFLPLVKRHPTPWSATVEDLPDGTNRYSFRDRDGEVVLVDACGNTTAVDMILLAVNCAGWLTMPIDDRVKIDVMEVPPVTSSSGGDNNRSAFIRGAADLGTGPGNSIAPAYLRAVVGHPRLIDASGLTSSSPLVGGTAIAVNHIVSLVVDGWLWDDILRSHPELDEEDIRACLAYAVETTDLVAVRTAHSDPGDPISELSSWAVPDGRPVYKRRPECED